MLIFATLLCRPGNADTTLPVAPIAPLIDASATYRLTNCEAGQTSMTITNPETLTSISSEYSWLRPSIADGKLILDYDENANSGQRMSRVYLARKGFTTSTMTVYQPGTTFNSDLAALIPQAQYVTPSSATASSTINNNYTERGIELTYDGDTSTFYHSGYFTSTDSTSYPVLEYFFDQSFNLGEITYVPLNYSGYAGNGWFGVVEIYTRSASADDYTLALTYDFGMKSTTQTVAIPEAASSDIVAVKFRVTSGKHGKGLPNCWASCAEMKFSTRVIAVNDSRIFADDVYSQLATGVTLADIDAMSNPMLQSLARRLYTQEYSSEGRVATIVPTLSLGEYCNRIKSYGQYDAYQGATGIVVGKGTNIVIVSGIPSSMGTTKMELRSWLPTSDRSESYTIKNGINVIEKTTDWDGLAYISNYNSQANISAGNVSTITVHIVDGAVNGVIRATQTNEQNQAIIDNACHGSIDVVGQRAHAIWQTASMNSYCKGKYVQYVNLLDQLVIWIHRMMGVEKYGLLSNNLTLAYTCNWNYMTQTGTGVAINCAEEYRVCSFDKLSSTDSDAVWGLSHEWGHQHQMDPYFRWSGTWEVTNNMNAWYNLVRMGYAGTVVTDNRSGGITMLVNDNHTKTNSTTRQEAITQAQNGTFDWSPELKAFILSQTDTITRFADDPRHALTPFETTIGHQMGMLFSVFAYFGEQLPDNADGTPYRLNDYDYVEDFAPDLYQAIRTTDATEGSTVEKSAIDKYEMIAHAQNGSNAKYQRLVADYPQSVWVTKGYLNGSNNKGQNLVPFVLNYIRKASRLSGYNLVPFFERWGMLRAIAMRVGDYTSSYYIMPDDMLDEFISDMDDLGLRPVSDELIERISNVPVPQYQRPVFPDDHATTDTEIVSIKK